MIWPGISALLLVKPLTVFIVVRFRFSDPLNQQLILVACHITSHDYVPIHLGFPTRLACRWDERMPGGRRRVLWDDSRSTLHTFITMYTLIFVVYLFYYILYLHLFTQNLYAHFWSFFAAMFIHLFRRFFGPTNAALQPLAFPIGTNKIHQGFFPRAQQCSKPMLGDELALGQCPNLPLIFWGLSQFSWAIHGNPLVQYGFLRCREMHGWSSFSYHSPEVFNHGWEIPQLSGFCPTKPTLRNSSGIIPPWGQETVCATCFLLQMKFFFCEVFPPRNWLAQSNSIDSKVQNPIFGHFPYWGW